MSLESKKDSQNLSSFEYYKNLAYKVYNADNLSNDGVRFGCLFSLLSTCLAKNGLKNTMVVNSPLVFYTLNLASTHLVGYGYDYFYPQDKEEIKDSFSKKFIQGTTANALSVGVSKLSTTVASKCLPGYQLIIFSALWLTSMPFSFVAMKKTTEYIDIDLNYYIDSVKNIYSTDILSNDGTKFGYVIAGLTTHHVMTIAHKKGFSANFAISGTPILATTSVYLAGLCYDYFYLKDKEEPQDSFYKELVQFGASSALFFSCVMLTNNLADKYFP